MRLINEIRRTALAASGDQPVVGLERVRGIDLRFAGRGLVVESREPFAVLVGGEGVERRLPIAPAGGAPALPMALVPIAVFALARLRSARRRR